MLVFRGFYITERRFAPHKFALFCARLPDGTHFFGYILRVHLVQNIFEWCNVVILFGAVIAVVDRHIPDAVLGKEEISVLSGHNVVTP